MDTYSTYCAYRGSEGLKCAIGVFIPDELYKPEIEKSTFYMIINYDGPYAEIRALKTYLEEQFADNNTRSLAVKLQDIHDSSPPELWKEKLTELAKKLDLQMPEAKQD